MADAPKKKVLKKFFGGKKKGSKKKAKVEEPADDGMDAWKNVPDVAPKGVAPKPAVAVGALDHDDGPAVVSAKQLVDTEIASAALEEARKNAKKRELLGDEMQTGEVAPKEETLMERIARRRREAATAGLRDETNFPSLGGAKASRKPASSSSKASPWDLSKVEIAEEELEAARAPKLEGEGDTGLGLKATLLPGSKPIETSEELDSALKAIAGDYAMMQSADSLCTSLAELAPVAELGGPRARAFILINFLHDSVAEDWEEKEVKAVEAGLLALLERQVVDREGIREAFTSAMTGWFDDTIKDFPHLPKRVKDITQGLVLKRVIRASQLPKKVVDACVPRVNRLVEEEAAKDRGEEPPSAMAAPVSASSAAPRVSAGPPRISALASLGSFLEEAAKEREGDVEAPTAAKAASGPAVSAPAAASAESAAASAAPAAGGVGDEAEADGLDDLYAEASKKKGKKGKKVKKKKKGADFALEGEGEEETVAAPAVPVVEVQADAAAELEDLYAAAGKKKAKKAKKKSA